MRDGSMDNVTDKPVPKAVLTLVTIEKVLKMCFNGMHDRVKG